MVYPLPPHAERDETSMANLAKTFPFAHFFTTSQDSGKRVTRLPFAVDMNAGKMTGLRAHLNAQNPQAQDLDGQEALIAFSGPDSYISPNWRVDRHRGATWDYTAVHVWGRVTCRPERAFFEQLINDLAAAAEPRFEGVSDHPDWSISDAPKDYVDRLFPLLLAFEVSIDRVEGISKLHQDFPKEDAKSVVDHLNRSEAPESHAVAALIEERLKRD